MLKKQKLLVSTYRAGKIYLLAEREDGIVVEGCHRCRRPMGMALSDGQEMFALGLLDSIEIYRRRAGCYRRESVVDTGRINIHEMAFLQSGELIYNNTDRSSLFVLRPGQEVEEFWQPPWLKGEEGRDHCHLNGLALQDGHIRYVTSFNQGDEALSWQGESRLRDGVLFDTQRNVAMATALCMPHSPMVHAGKVWFCDSGRGELACVDASGKKVVLARLGAFIRGLTFTQEHAIVGISSLRNGVRARELPVYGTGSDECGVLFINLGSGVVEHKIILGTSQLRNTPCEVFDVCLVPHDFQLEREA